MNNIYLRRACQSITIIQTRQQSLKYFDARILDISHANLPVCYVYYFEELNTNAKFGIVVLCFVLIIGKLHYYCFVTAKEENHNQIDELMLTNLEMIGIKKFHNK
jgi:hypothetical protein